MTAPVHVKRNLRTACTDFEFIADHGDLYGWLNRNDGFFHISNFNVDPTHRRQGIGKALLQTAYSEGLANGATHFGATILSHACLDSMGAIFGRDAIHALKVTPYDQVTTSEHDGTRAALLHTVEGFSIDDAYEAALLEDMLYFGMPKDQRPAKIDGVLCKI